MGKPHLESLFPGAILSNLKDITGATLINPGVLKEESHLLLALVTRLNINQPLSLKDVFSFTVCKSESVTASSPVSCQSSGHFYFLPSLQNGQCFAKLDFL